MTLVSAGALICTIILNYMLVPRFGMIGGAISAALVEVGMLLTLLRGAKSRVGIWPYDRRWLKGIAATICSAAALCLLRSWIGASAQLALIPNIAVAGGVFWAVLLLLGLDPEERRMLWERGS
jgi:O-antigen/teichoic acid export membrane protein